MKQTLVSLLICMAMAMAGCGGGDSETTTALSVSSVTPLADATDAAVTTMITATFNRTIDCSTLTTSTFTLTGVGGAAVAGTVSYDASTYTATFTPTYALGNLVAYTATITTGVGLASNYTWDFTTVSRKVLFESQRAPDGTNVANTNNTFNIWTVNSDGSSATVLASMTAANAGAWMPQWSPDGTKIVFESQRAINGSDAATSGPSNNIWVMNADGSSPTALTSLDAAVAWSGEPQWSPDGTKIVFASNRALDGSDAVNGAINIWVINADGSGATALTSLTANGIQGFQSQWSPDGTKIVYSSTRAVDGSDARSVNDVHNIWVINADGSSSTVLTSLINLTAWTGNWGPRWSPDGTKIAFNSPRALDGSDAANTNDTYNVWSMNADGSSVTALTSLTANNTDCGIPHWSPDGTKLAYESGRKLDGTDAANTNNTDNIWSMNADGSSATVLTSLTANNADSVDPHWSQDETIIVYTTRRALDGSDTANTNNTANIWVMDIDGSSATALTPLTADDADSMNPQW